MTEEANPRAVAGSNMPPPVDTMAIHIEDLFSLASGSTASPVTTDEQDAALDSLLDDIREAKAAAEAQCETEYRPHKAAADGVKALWKPLLARCDAAASEIKAALTPYRTAKQKAKDEAAQKARDEAAAKLAQAQVALRSSDDLETRFTAEEQLKQAGKLEAGANKIDRSATGLRTHWEAEVTDRRDALNFYIKRSPERFAALVQQLADEDARGARAPVPGIVFHERKRAA